MKPNEQSCRNCGGTELFSQEVDANGTLGPKLLPIGFTSMAGFHIRVCGSCGLVEWFVPSKHLEDVKQKFRAEP